MDIHGLDDYAHYVPVYMTKYYKNKYSVFTGFILTVTVHDDMHVKKRHILDCTNIIYN